MASKQPEYYRARAAQERQSAASAPNPTLARVHEDLAAMYDRMARDSQATERKRALAEQADAYVEEIA